MEWASSLPLLLGDLERVTTIESVDITHLPKSFSFSEYLSSQAKDAFLPPSITAGNSVLSSTEIVSLALNEQGKTSKRGKFYALPDREDRRYGHACDIVLVADPWTRNELREWDNATWEDRLKLFKLEDMSKYKITPNSSVIPICARILGHDEDTDSDSDLESSSTANWSTMSDYTTTSIGSHSTTSDPALRPGSIRYSRPMQDQSTYILLYKTRTSKPLLCHSAALEHPSITVASLTPGDLSETFEVGPHHQDPNFKCCAANDSQLVTSRLAAQMVKDAEVKDNQDVVEKLCSAVDGEDGRDAAEKNALGRVTRMWQELLNQIETRPHIRELPAGWPLA